MHKLSVREIAISLRKAGYSYAYISAKTGLPKSTLSGWLASVPYTPNAETVRRVGKAIAAANARKSKIKQQTFLEARQEAKKEIGLLSNRDIFMFGLGLYLGEGSKTNDVTRIVNSDPKVISLALKWFEVIGLSRASFAITLHLYPDTDVEKSIAFWSAHTGLPRPQFLKVQIDWRKNKKMYKLGKLPYGTAHLSVRSLGNKKFGVALSRKILACIEEVSSRIEKRGRGLPV